MTTGDELQPWEQQPDESGPAYVAFAAYRDLGVGRSIDAAFHATKGQRGGNARATGRWTKWSSDHKWADRARSWDLHQSRVRQKAAEEAERSSARRWIRRRDELLERSHEVAMRLLGQANMLSLMPVIEQAKQADGMTTIVSAAPPATIRAAAATAREAMELAGAAIEKALELQDQEQERTVTLTPRPVTEAQGEATRRVEAHRAAMRARMLTMSPVAPGLSLNGASPEAGREPGAGSG